jgi:hypothetical protein
LRHLRVGPAAPAQFVSNGPGIVMVAGWRPSRPFAALLTQLLDHQRIDFGPSTSDLLK